jgi:hypothetical protein
MQAMLYDLMQQCGMIHVNAVVATLMRRREYRIAVTIVQWKVIRKKHRYRDDFCPAASSVSPVR